MWYTQIADYYAAVKGNEVQIHMLQHGGALKELCT